MKTIAQRLTICCLLLWCFMGSMMAQDDPFVIKKGGHYLAHVKVNGTWVLKDVITFHPDSCLWYSGTEFNSSGTNHNYYFEEVFENGTSNYHFLSAPLEPNASLSYSSSTPYTYLLRNREGIYYFWDWDWDNPNDGGGLASAYQYTDATTEAQCAAHNGSWENTGTVENPRYECWEVYWVECTGNETDGYTWQLSPASSYHITGNAARFRKVSVTENVSVLENSGLRELKADGTAIPSTGIVMDYSGDCDRALSATIVAPYQYTVNSVYTFENANYPINKSYSVGLLTSPYHWTISGEGKDYLSFESGSQVLASHSATPTLYYRTENLTGDKTATLTLTVSYQYGATQTLSTTVTLRTSCQNPGLAAAPVVTHSGVTLRWINTNAEAYKLWWRKKNTGEWASIDKGTATSHTFPVEALEYETTYEYWISAKCGGTYLDLAEGTDPFEFTTKPEPNLIVYGAVYGGGRVADVTGKTEVVVINCDSLGSVYGGNDIAGAVQDANGSKIQIGVKTGDENASLGVTQDTIMIGSVYGGGNGYYAYNGTSFTAASSEYSSQVVISGASVHAMTQNNQMGDVVWTNETNEAVTLNFPTIVKTEITVKTDYIKIDSLFGGAKNAFLTQDGLTNNGSSITVDGGTLFAVFGGNNIGGTVGTAKHHIEVNQTKTKLALGIQSTATTGYGRDFGIRYLFGGGNKVPGSTTDITITGGQMDTIFGGGNMASVTASYMEVACPAGAATSGSSYTFNKVYSNAIASYTNGKFVMKENGYDWDGNGIYNVHTLFGGNNKAPMYGVPHITLTSGSVGTAYGGGNAGDMKACVEANNEFQTFINHETPKWVSFNYGTKIEMTQPNMVVDYLYGGCQVSNVDYSTYVSIKDGHIGSVYGGCNVSGDVGSTRTNPNAAGPSGLNYQAVKGGTYVRATGGTVYKDFFAGSNGFYHCNDGTKYKAGIDYGDPEQHYIGMFVPTHNETHLFISKDEQHTNGVTIKGDAYAGGNLACVGFTNFTVPKDPETNQYKVYPQFVGLSSLHMDGGTVEGSVYGGGRMASVYGSNEVKVDGGTIGGALYGGNDRTGQVAQITNREWPIDGNDAYDLASDGYTSLSNVNTYVGITGNPQINTVYGGGNGAYIYEGEEADMEYCLLNDQPIQSNTFVDIHLEDAGRINTVFGGGNGVTVTGEITVFFNVNVEGPNNYASPDENHVGTIFGGNNLGSLDILSNIILLRGKVGTVYGGCNEGAMVGSTDLIGTSYTNVGSYVRLLNEYPTAGSPMVPFAEVTGAVYGGCRMNGVTNNSLVLVEGGNHPNADIYGGSDISGDVAGTSQVVVTNGTHITNGPVIANAFGGGNGEYNYTSGEYAGLNPPYSVTSRVEMKGGTAGNTYAGGNNGECGLTEMRVEGGTVTGRVFGGGNMAGVVMHHPLTIISVDEYGHPTVNTNPDYTTDGTSTVNIIGGQVNGGIFGGNNLSGTIESVVNVNIYGGTLGTSTAVMTDGIFGGGYGAESKTDDNVTVTIGNGTTPTIYGDVYGGSALGQVNTDTDNLTLVDFKDGNLHGNLFGGGMGRLRDETDPNNIISAVSALVNGNAKVAISNGTIYDNVYGGCNLNGIMKGNVLVDITGGSVGVNNTATADVFGGGFGNLTDTEGNVVVNINGASAYVYGDVYGGSALGNVNKVSDNTTTYTTEVNILNGFVKQTTIGGVAYGGDIYGGGLGQKNGYNGATSDILAKVNGKVYVNIGSINGTTLIGNATIDGSVYGCNNVNGSPQDNVFVNIYKTAHTGTNYYPFNPPTPYTGWDVASLEVNELGDANNPAQTYALQAVYGGGNMAAYIPLAVSGEDPKCTTVHVYGCEENTIKDVYGGGNAADVGVENGQVVNTKVIIDGGRIHRMFGGGNGDGENNPGANIFGTARSEVYAGLIDQVYGGANKLGSIDVIDLNVFGSDESNACDQVYGMVFGCANAAPLNHSITTTIGCPVGTIGQLYGGSFQAPIGDPNNPNANVTLNVYGGNYEYVFGGSKGKAAVGDDPGVSADIYGDVTLNLFGGTITNAFGGTDVKGIVRGKITVNVLDHESHCPLDVTNIYGAGNLTAYTPYSESGIPTSPVVNVMHVKSTNEIHGNVYGGAYGSEATVTSNPQVNIGYDSATMETFYNSHLPNPAPEGYMGPDGIPSAHVHGIVYGGGELAEVMGTSTVNLLHQNASANQLYGGGHMVGTTNTVVNVYNGAVVPVTNEGTVSAPAVYGGCNDDGTITGYTEVNILNNLGATGDGGYNVNVFGGGRGANTDTEGNVTVNFGGSNTTPILYGNIYGGSALGTVNDGTDDLTKVDLKSGTVNGDVFGGGLGVVDDPTTTDEDEGVEAHVNGNIQVVGNGGSVNGWVFGANDQNGDPAGTVEVVINNGSITNVVGGGNVADYTAPSGSGGTIVYSPYVHITGGTVTNMVVGGGNMADINGNTKVELTGGIVGSANHEAHIFGGGYGQGTKVTGNVLVNFGEVVHNASDVEIHTDEPILYGDVYGGSALGNVNANENNTTTVNLLNGTIHGGAYGGGLGQKAGVNNATTNIEAIVFGVVHVNVGNATDPDDETTFTGQANLSDCDVYGCNNQNGWPMQDVYVDVYKTYHTDEDIVNYTGALVNAPYGIHQVFGGGNESDFTISGKKNYVYVHRCRNTIWRVFGGGNAADVQDVVLKVDGGRFEWIFGGGNGEAGVSYAANVIGLIDIRIGGGLIEYLVNGSNLNGTAGNIHAENYNSGCDDSEITNHFMGSNSDDIYGDIYEIVPCGSTMKYVNLYGGSNLAQIYGNITLIIQGGMFKNVYGGSRGRKDDPSGLADFESSIWDYTSDYIAAYNDTTTHQHLQAGDGGNIRLVFNGGSIGNVYGGCHLNGNIEGKITIIVEANQTTCPLFIGNIYGAGQKTDYVRSHAEKYSWIDFSPEINVLNGTIGGNLDFNEDNDIQDDEKYPGNIFGGGDEGHVYNSDSRVTIGDNTVGNTYEVKVLGDVYGGGNSSNFKGNTKIILQGKSTIGHTETIEGHTELVGGNVFGGGKEGNVMGSVEVIIESPVTTSMPDEPEPGEPSTPEEP